MIERSFDAEDGIILVRSIGRATREEIDGHYDALRTTIAGVRETGRPVRVLSDQTEAAWLSADLNRHIIGQIERTYRAGDRLAMLMPSIEAKAYVRGLLSLTDYAVFSSRIAAEIWLMEASARPPRG